MWFSRRREFSADTTSAVINGSEKMISALKRLSKNAHHSLFSEQITALGITGGVVEGLAGRMNNLSIIFSSHPPLIKRINAIEKQLIELS
jgi:heat shock protein HtpX